MTKAVAWDVKHQFKQTNNGLTLNAVITNIFLKNLQEVSMTLIHPQSNPVSYSFKPGVPFMGHRQTA